MGRLWQRLAARGGYPIGLHIGMDRVTLVQMQPQGRGPAIRAAASISYGCPRSELLADRQRLNLLIKRALADHPFRGKRVVSCMPNDQLKMMVLSFSPAKDESDADALVRELRSRLRSDLGGKIIDFVPVRQPEFQSLPHEAIVAMAERDQVTAYLDLLSACGLQVEALEVGPVALARVVSSIGADNKGEIPNLLLITFGTRSSYLTVVWGRRLLLDRAVDFAEHQLVSRLCTVLGMSEAAAKELLLERGFAGGGRSGDNGEVERMLKDVLRPGLAALKSEVNKTLSYTASKTRGRIVDKIYVTGSLARYPGIEGFLGEHFTLPVEVLNPSSIFPRSLKGREMEHLWLHSGVVAATGLALRGVPQQWLAST